MAKHDLRTRVRAFVSTLDFDEFTALYPYVRLVSDAFEEHLTRLKGEVDYVQLRREVEDFDGDIAEEIASGAGELLSEVSMRDEEAGRGGG